MSGFDWLFFIEITLAGLGSGGLFALTAFAFVLIYKATRVVNLAIGEILMLGAYLFFGFASSLALPVWLAIPAAVGTCMLVGLVIERVMIRPMVGENPISIFMITVGLASVLVGIVELVWGADPLSLPPFIPERPMFLPMGGLGEAFMSAKIATAFVVAMAGVVVLLLAFRYSRAGVQLRATASDQAAAWSMGIRVPAVFARSWALACGIAGIAGVLVGAIGGLSPTMGVFGLSVLVVVIVGGLDSFLGALVAGLLVGLVEAHAGAWLGGEYKLVSTFVLLVVVLMIRPYGLFGTHEIERL